jgi:hypothetical protein
VVIAARLFLPFFIYTETGRTNTQETTGRDPHSTANSPTFDEGAAAVDWGEKAILTATEGEADWVGAATSVDEANLRAAPILTRLLSSTAPSSASLPPGVAGADDVELELGFVATSGKKTISREVP